MSLSTAGHWYHGDSHPEARTSFVGQRMDRRRGFEDFNANGPGIYWTRDFDQARGYSAPNGHLYIACLASRRVIFDDTPNSAAWLGRMIDLCPTETWDNMFENWGETKGAAKRACVAAWMDRTDKLIDALIGLYGDVYQHDATEWTTAMVQLGFDAFLHELPLTDHLIVYNPAALVVTATYDRKSEALAALRRDPVNPYAAACPRVPKTTKPRKSAKKE